MDHYEQTVGESKSHYSRPPSARNDPQANQAGSEGVSGEDRGAWRADHPAEAGRSSCSLSPAIHLPGFSTT